MRLLNNNNILIVLLNNTNIHSVLLNNNNILIVLLHSDHPSNKQDVKLMKSPSPPPTPPLIEQQMDNIFTIQQLDYLHKQVNYL